jgi:hypothetical protein
MHFAIGRRTKKIKLKRRKVSNGRDILRILSCITSTLVQGLAGSHMCLGNGKPMDAASQSISEPILIDQRHAGNQML